jgi:hypothetical protein
MRGLPALLLAVLGPAAASAPPIAWHDPIEVAVGHGERGPWRQNESRYDFVDDPTVAIDDRGEVVLAWVDQARKDVLVQRVSADGKKQAQPINVSRNPATFSWLPRLVLAPHDPRKIGLLWQEIIFSGGSHGGDILFAHSEDGGKTFSEPLDLSSSVGGDGKGRLTRDVWDNGSLDLAAGAGGTRYAAWTEYQGSLWFSRSTDGGKTFSRPRRVTGDDAKPARAPALAVGADHSVYLAWTIGEDGADIRVAKSTDGGATFREPRIVARTRSYSDAPKLAVDPGGALHLVYGEGNHVEYTRSTDGARTFEAPRRVSGPGAGFPALSVDASGHLYVTWELFHQDRRPPRGLGLASSRDGGRTFSPGAAVPNSADPAGGGNGSSQGLLMKKLAVNARGAVAIVNSSFKEGERSRVWLMLGRP